MAATEGCAQELERVTPRNAWMVTLDGAGWHVGITCLSWTAILPAWVAHLGGGPFASAAVVGLWIGGVRLPQSLSSWWVHGRSRSRDLLLRIAALQRFAIAGVVLAALFAREGSRASLAAFFACYALWCLGTGLAYPVWVDFLSRSLHPSSTGRVLGLRNAVASTTGVAASLLATALLGRLAFPGNFAATFGLGLAALVLGFPALALTRECPREEVEPATPFPAYLRSCFALVRSQPGFARLILGIALLAFLHMPTGLFLHDAFERFAGGIAPAERDRWAGIYTLSQTLALALAAWPAGRATDHFGARRMIVVGGIVAAAGALAPLIARGLASYAVVFVLQGLTFATFNVAIIKLYMELGRGAARSRAMVLAEAAVAPVVLISTLSGGAAVAWLGYPPIFVASALLTFAGALVVASGGGEAGP